LATLSSTLALGSAARPREFGANYASHWFAHALLALALAFTVAAAALGDTFFLRLGTEALIFSGLAMAVDLLLGYTGMLSLGQAMFFGLGAYTSALLLKHVAPSFWLAMGGAVAMGTAAGILGALISVRARGVYFALITFGMAQVVSKVVYNTRSLGASDGIIGIPVIQANFLLFRVDTGNPVAFFLLVLAITVGAYYALAYLVRTPFGRVLVAVRTNEARVPFLGYETRVTRFVAFLAAANLASIFGALYPMLRGFVSPELMYFTVSGDAVIAVVIGGLGTLIGPIYGSVLLVALRSVLGTYTGHHLVIIGVFFMLVVIAFPKGLVGYLMTLRARRRAEASGGG
jgi:branched-chain amino acid transport system permease protein